MRQGLDVRVAASPLERFSWSRPPGGSKGRPHGWYVQSGLAAFNGEWRILSVYW